MAVWKYVRRKDDPTVILSQGFSDFSGQFDAAVYEQVEGRPPEGVTREVPQDNAAKMKRLFEAQTAAVRAQFYTLKAAVKDAMSEGDVEAAKLIVQNAQGVPPGLEPMRQQLLAILSGR